MLLYNHKKEFIGVDNENLSALGFQNIAELQNESHDFADLFVKKPGFIHNFKNFSWIDFILHSDSNEDPKAVIHAKGKNFACNLHVAPFSFASNETGYSITIKNLRVLKGAEDEQATRDLEASGGLRSSSALEPKQIIPDTKEERQISETDISFDDVKAPTQKVEAPNVTMTEPELPNFDESYAQELSEPEPFDIPEPDETELGFASENEFGAPSGIDYTLPLTLDDDVMQDTLGDEASAPQAETKQEVSKETPMLGDYISESDGKYLSDLINSGEYVYDPKIAANELGLPVDLIEEFIGDFIDQAHEFHDDLFASVKSGDFDNVQNLSHKLKGVAANLRVEDAFDTLSVVNHSKDIDEILPNLNYFYKIIAKLEGKELPQEVNHNMATEEPKAEIEDEDIDYNIGIKHPETGSLLINENEIDSQPSDDDVYDNLLSSPSEEFTAPLVEQESLSIMEEDEDDIYGNLLPMQESESNDLADMTSSYEESLNDDPYALSEDFQQHDDPYEIPVDPSFNEDIYGSSNHYIAPEEEADLGKAENEPQDENFEIPADSSFDESFDDDILGSSDDYLSMHEEPTPIVETPSLNFDAQRTADELGIPLDIVHEFLQDFKEQVLVHQNDFDAAIADEDIKKVNQTATVLKGMSDNLRLSEISEVLKQLQQEENINNTTKALASLQAYVDQI